MTAAGRGNANPSPGLESGQMSKVSILALGITIGMLLADLIADRSQRRGVQAGKVLTRASALTAAVTLIIYFVFG